MPEPGWRGTSSTDRDRPRPAFGPAWRARRFTDLTRPMNLSSLLYPATVRAHVQIDSKKALFPYVGDLAARSLGLDSGEVAEALLERERLGRSEEHTSELQSLMRISYAVFCLKKKNTNKRSRNKPTTK